MAGIEDLPSEVIEEILLLLDPTDVAQFAQTCSDYYALVYGQEDQHLWRELYLRQPLDDPRRSYTSLGHPLPAIDWKSQLQRIMRAAVSNGNDLQHDGQSPSRPIPDVSTVQQEGSVNEEDRSAQAQNEEEETMDYIQGWMGGTEETDLSETTEEDAKLRSTLHIRKKT